jgi:hypothetical protein
MGGRHDPDRAPADRPRPGQRLARPARIRPRCATAAWHPGRGRATDWPPARLLAEGRDPGPGITEVDVAAAEAMTTRPGVPGPGQESAGLPGSNNRTLAVAAMSTLRAIPDPLVTESTPRPLVEPAQMRAGTVRSPRPARRQQLFRFFPPLRRSVPERRWMGWSAGPLGKVASAGGTRRETGRHQPDAAQAAMAPSRTAPGQARPPGDTAQASTAPASTAPGKHSPQASTAPRAGRGGAPICFCFLLIVKPRHRCTDRPP